MKESCLQLTGELSLDKIARYVPSLSMDELRKLEAEVMQLLV